MFHWVCPYTIHKYKRDTIYETTVFRIINRQCMVWIPKNRERKEASPIINPASSLCTLLECSTGSRIISWRSPFPWVKGKKIGFGGGWSDFILWSRKHEMTGVYKTELQKYRSPLTLLLNAKLLMQKLKPHKARQRTTGELEAEKFSDLAHGWKVLEFWAARVKRSH